MAIRKYAKRFGRAVGKRLRKRYIAPKSGGLRVGKIARDVMYLKSLVNSEKKRFVLSTYDQVVGQIAATSTTTFVEGSYVTDITPNMGQGVTNSTRNGSSIRMCSLNVQLQIKQQSSSQSPLKLKFMWVLNRGITTSAVNFLSTFVQPNPFNTVRDFNSFLNPDNIKNYKIMRTKTVTIPADQLTSALMIKDFRVGFKFKNGHHIRYDGNTSTVTAGQMFLVCLADSGNDQAIAYSGASTGLTQVGASTGANISFVQTLYYYDN